MFLNFLQLIYYKKAIFVQGIGVLGLISAIISFQSNKRIKILVFLGIGQIFFAIHFALLGAKTASGMNLIGAIRTFSFILRERKKYLEKNILMFLFIALFWATGILCWDKWISILPVIGMTFETIALWMKEPKKIRIGLLSPRPLWLTYNIIYNSYPGVLAEAFVLTSIFIGIVRFDLFPVIKKSN
ncbi:MAG: YgjV family protein [candidate division WOR-3 bacterium]